MKNHIFLSVITSLFITFESQAQYTKTISSGRPGQANGPFGVGKRVYQIQSGIDFDKAKSDFGNKETSLYCINQNSVIRIGLLEHFELRVAYGYQFIEKFKSTQTTEFATENRGFNAFHLGVRQNITKQNGIIPAIGVQFTAKFGGINYYERNKYNYEGKLLLQHKISDNLSLNTNLSMEYNDQEQNTFGRYVFSFGYTLNDKFGLVAETYGVLESQNSSIYFDGGLAYLPSNDLQLDIYGGYGSNVIGTEKVDVNSFFISAGVSFRINTRD